MGSLQGATRASEGARTMQVIHESTDWRGVRQKLVKEARERRQADRSLTLQQKSQTTSVFAKMRKELAEEDSIKNSVKLVLCPPKEPHKVEQDKRRKATKVSYTVNNAKERLFVRHDTMVKRDEINRIREQLAQRERHVAALEAKSDERVKQFEDKIQTASQIAQEALNEMEQWRRKRVSLAQPIIKLTNAISAMRSKNVALKVTLESNMYMKLFIDCVTDNFTQSYGRPSTLESYREKDGPKKATEDSFRPMIEANDVIAELEDLEERNLRMIESFQTSQDNLDDTVKHFLILAKRKDVELKHMKYQKYLINSTLQRCTERATELQFFCETFAEGDNERGFFDKDELLLTLRHYVRRVYRQSVCMSDIELNVDTLDMLTAIETRMEDLIDTEETMKPDEVRGAQRDLERVRRVKAKEDQETAKREHQKMRTKRALERLNEAKATQGRKLMKRSTPKDCLKKESLHTLLEDINEKLEQEFFFT